MARRCRPAPRRAVLDAAIGSDLSQALATLFQAAVQSANLTQ